MLKYTRTSHDLWLIHTARNRDRDREMIRFYITLCTIHTTQGQEPLFCIVSIPVPLLVPVPCRVYEPLFTLQGTRAGGGIGNGGWHNWKQWVLVPVLVSDQWELFFEPTDPIPGPCPGVVPVQCPENTSIKHGPTNVCSQMSSFPHSSACT